MANTIKLKNSGTTTNSPSALEYGELAINYADGKLFYKDDAGSIVDFANARSSVSDTAPSNPSEGDIWFESDTGDVYVYYDSVWVDVGGTSVANIAMSDTAPSSPINGDFWFETDTGRTFVYYDDGTSQQWIEVGAASAAASGADGSVQFASGGTFSSDDANLHWDDTNNRLGIGTNSPAVALDVVGTTDTDYLTVGGENVTPYTGRRNLLYNGAMQVAQRGTSVSSQYVSNYYTVDRWQWFSNATGARWDMAQDTDAPDGFSNSWKITCSQALASPASGDYYQVSQRLEGYDIQHLAKGLSNAKQVTLSFWVKSNVTGTYNARLLDQNNRAIHRSYTVNTVNTWEYKTLTYAGDTSGTITSANTEGWRLTFWLGSGSHYNSGTLQTSWDSYVPANSAVGQTNLASAVNNYWQVTGVQLEVGDKATPFEHRSFGEELALCQRYYEKSYIQSHAPGTATYTGAVTTRPWTTTSGYTYVTHTFAVTKRTTPTITIYSVADGSAGFWFEGGFGNRSGGADNHGESGFNLRNTVVLAGTGHIFCHWVAVAEL